MRTAAAAAEPLQNAAAASQATAAQSAHVCLAKPCAFCAVMNDEPVPESRLVQLLGPAKRRLLSDLNTELMRKTEEYLDSILYIVRGLPNQRAAAAVAPKQRLELVYSSAEKSTVD